MNGFNFTEYIRERGHELYRAMPWRGDTRLYYVLVSELMLQQTQVARVIPKFEAFIERFPDEKSLAVAPLAGVLVMWQGLGYNRRAKFLHEAAKLIVKKPDYFTTPERLAELPGVGPNTAGAIAAYSFNLPSIFVETNIRTVYIHHFFADRDVVLDTEITEVLQQTLDKEHPREFYWALMDYGAHLKSQGIRTNARSKHYKKQPRLAGSMREMRGSIVRDIAGKPMTKQQLAWQYEDDPRLDSAIDALLCDGLIDMTGDTFHLTNR